MINDCIGHGDLFSKTKGNREGLCKRGQRAASRYHQFVLGDITITSFWEDIPAYFSVAGHGDEIPLIDYKLFCDNGISALGQLGPGQDPE